jgi:hypothetical protein
LGDGEYRRAQLNRSRKLLRETVTELLRASNEVVLLRAVLEGRHSPEAAARLEEGEGVKG